MAGSRIWWEWSAICTGDGWSADWVNSKDAKRCGNDKQVAAAYFEMTLMGT